MTLAVALPITLGLSNELIVWGALAGVVLARVWRMRP